MARYVEVKMTKTTLCFTEPELVRLLSRDVELWQKAIRRGKYIKRERAAERR